MHGPTERYNRETEHIEAQRQARRRRIAIDEYLIAIPSKYPDMTVRDAFHKE